MKMTSMFARVVTIFILFQMFSYAGKTDTKIYMHIIYWIIMIPNLYYQFWQLRGSYTVSRTRLICAGLLVRLLLSNFDFEGRWLGKVFYIRIVALTINYIAGSFLTVFLCMFIQRPAISYIVTLAVASLQSASWYAGSYNHKTFVDKDQ